MLIEQDYENGGPTSIPTNGVPITGLTLSKIKETVSNTATNISTLYGPGSCSSWTWSEVSVSGGKRANSCRNVPSGDSC